jgi:GTP-binding protein
VQADVFAGLTVTEPSDKAQWRIVDAKFLAAAAPGTELPAPITVEVAFGGRSNVGKSSLINAMLERKNLVRTSSTPGSTRQLNLYEARARDGAVFHLVDLPGYGYTKRSRSETASWKQLVESYLRGRPTLAAMVLLVDVRRGLEDDDRELCEFVADLTGVPRPGGREGVELLLVATKLDKLSRSAQRPALQKVVRDAGVRARVLGFSAVTGEGRAELWTAIRRASGLELPAGVDQGEGAPPRQSG